MKLCRHDFGTIIAVGLQDEHDQIELHFFSFWNHQATSGELHWINEKFAYFWTTPQNLRFAITEQCLFKLLNIDFGKSKGIKRGLMPQAQIMAEVVLNSIEYIPFLGNDASEDESTPYLLGYLDDFTPDVSKLYYNGTTHADAT